MRCPTGLMAMCYWRSEDAVDLPGGDGGGTHPDNTPATIVITPSTSIIDQSGKVTGAKTGSSSISASAGGVSSASVNVGVMPGTATQLVIRTQPAGAVSHAAPLR